MIQTNWRLVGQRIERELKRHGMTAEDLAKKVRVSRYTPYKWINGGKMDAHHLEAVAAVLGMHPAVLRYGSTAVSIPEFSAAAAVATKICSQEKPDASADEILALASQLYQYRIDLGARIENGEMDEYARTLVQNLMRR